MHQINIARINNLNIASDVQTYTALSNAINSKHEIMIF